MATPPPNEWPTSTTFSSMPTSRMNLRARRRSRPGGTAPEAVRRAAEAREGRRHDPAPEVGQPVEDGLVGVLAERPA